MSAETLMDALAAAGCPARVEARGRLAVVITEDPRPLADETIRRTALRLAREHGFTHLALELADAGEHEEAVRRAESVR